ncbi:RNA-dependent RNA polymerase 1 [Phlyctema vagabunda]|uniref:RNA-dependent RNA polymerase n=1 Tax=Phlyctema vagabunda TaxID=108571 RepID=A0ABR4PA76_9HELO
MAPTDLIRILHTWQKFPSLKLTVAGLPQEADARDLKRTFEGEGNIVYLSLFEDTTGSKNGRAVVRFSPAPLRNFWQTGHYKMILRGKQYSLHIRVTKTLGDHQVQSPSKSRRWYDERYKLWCDSLDFGVMLQSAIFMPLQNLQKITDREDLTFSIDLLRKRIVVEFTVPFRDPRHDGLPDPRATHTEGYLDRDSKFKFEVPFGLLKGINIYDVDTSRYALVFSVDSPPRVFKKAVEEEHTHTPGALSWSENDTWWRHCDIVYDPYRLKHTIVSLPKERPLIDIGRWKTYRFVFRRDQNAPAVFKGLRDALHDFNIDITEADIHSAPEHVATLWSTIDSSAVQDVQTKTTTYKSAGQRRDFTSDLLSLGQDGSTAYLPFEVRYQLEVCISRDIINEYNIGSDFVFKLAELARNDATKARTILEYVVEQDKRVYKPMSIFDDEDAFAYSPQTKIPRYCGYTRKATVTPTTLIFSSPTVETTNRITRHYAQENEEGRFLRVQFTDENFEGRINSNADRTGDDEVYTRVFRTLQNGIRIGDRHFEFLAFGNSQFRENGAYFYCPTEHLSCDDIRKWMGNFKHIRIPARYAARLGQCFSTTRAINGMSAPHLVKVPDIKRNGYNFTDGVGKISYFLAQMIAVELGLKIVPSAFQFRLGGCKGILVVSPEAKDKEVHIRESQQKFAATYNGLEIIRCSRFSCSALNRQTITILSALGVPDEVFLSMLAEQLAGYHEAMHDNNKALTLLARYIDDNHMTLSIASMILNGFMTERDPFVLSLLHLWRSWSIKLLKEKAKIIVEEGAFVLGCVDETDTLKGHSNPQNTRAYDSKDVTHLPEIFIQVPDRQDPTTYKVITGVCLVGRNPSLHPGDIRVVRAVDVEALHGLRDVVVFPQKGDRDIPSMCSGGDLDGDDFFVIWDEKLLPNEWNLAPMSYTAPTPVELRRSVKVDDLIKFFVKFMKNDALPTIAHNHLAQADFLTGAGGVKHAKCLELAELHSKAVDYVKTGLPAEMPKRLRIQKWPHFMEKKNKSKNKIYHSEAILGQLYDKVESVGFEPQYGVPFDRRILRAYKPENSILKAARQVKSQYDTAMRRIMAQQEIGTEFEVWTTFVLSKPRVGSDYKVQEDMDKITSAFKARFQVVCIERAGGKDFDVLGPFVAAMYRVTKEELDIALAECRAGKRKMIPKYMPLISFPWLFEKELARMATGQEAYGDIEELGALTFTTKKDTAASRARKAADTVEEDFIETEDGTKIHRGEELDLFSESGESGELSSIEDDSGDGLGGTYEGEIMNEDGPIREELIPEMTGTETAERRVDSKGNRAHVVNGDEGEVVPERTQVNDIAEVNMSGNNASGVRRCEGRIIPEFTQFNNIQADVGMGQGNSNGLEQVEKSIAIEGTRVGRGEQNVDLDGNSIYEEEQVEHEVILEGIGAESAMDRLARMLAS